MLLCPVCGKPLQEEKLRFCCENNHSFDRARSGYVNLLRTQKHRLRGDDAGMIRARRDFLDGGYYTPLLEKICFHAAQAEFQAAADIGCGEGWYACKLLEYLAEKGRRPRLAGFDISPDALRYAAHRAAQTGLSAQTVWAAATVSRLPLADSACGLLLNLFAPCEPAEFARILAPGGILLRAVPLERHLWELKTAVYDTPYENRPVLNAPEGFSLEAAERIGFRMRLSGDALRLLFAMTPYAHKTARSDAARLDACTEMEVSAEFGLLVCRKTE